MPVAPRFTGEGANGYVVAEFSVDPEQVEIGGPASRVARIGSVVTDPVDVSGVVGTSEFRVNTYVGDPFVRFRESPAVTVSVMMKKKQAPGRQQPARTSRPATPTPPGQNRAGRGPRENRRSEWARNCSEPTAFAAWRANIRSIRPPCTRSAWRWAGTLAAALESPEVLIGTDTRESGAWIAGLVAGRPGQAGARVRFAGVITTPGVAYLTRTGPFVAGVMISASHNPYQDNGIKVFGHSGFKLPDAEEHAIEQEIFRLRETRRARQPAALKLDEELDRALSGLSGFHRDACASTACKLVIDCGNGAAYRLAPELFRRPGRRGDAHLHASPTAATSI